MCPAPSLTGRGQGGRVGDVSPYLAAAQGAPTRPGDCPASSTCLPGVPSILGAQWKSAWSQDPREVEKHCSRNVFHVENSGRGGCLARLALEPHEADVLPCTYNA